MVVFDADFYFGEVVEDIEFCQVDGGVAVDLGGVTELDEIEPASTTFTTGCGAVFATDVLEVGTDGLD